MSESHEKDLSDLEKLLTALPPRPATLDRDHLLFRAGQASMMRSWVWPFATVIMSVAAGCLAMVLVLRPLPEPVVRIVQVQVPVTVPAPFDARDSLPQEMQQPPISLRETPSPTMSYWRMQQQALRFGVEGLPSTAADGAEAPLGPPTDSHELSAGSRPKLINHLSLFPVGEP
jgi:hypothetical protein